MAPRNNQRNSGTAKENWKCVGRKHKTSEHSHFLQQEQFPEDMEAGNHTSVTEFILLGLTEDPTLCVIFFVVFVGIYVITLIGNISIIINITVSAIYVLRSESIFSNKTFTK